jgi:hypothetical protein
MPKKLRPAVDLMAFKCRTLKVNNKMGICHLIAMVFTFEMLKNGQSKEPNMLLNISNNAHYGYQAPEGTVNK